MPRMRSRLRFLPRQSRSTCQPRATGPRIPCCVRVTPAEACLAALLKGGGFPIGLARWRWPCCGLSQPMKWSPICLIAKTAQIYHFYIKSLAVHSNAFNFAKWPPMIITILLQNVRYVSVGQTVDKCGSEWRSGWLWWFYGRLASGSS